MLRVFEFTQPVSSAIGFDDEIVMNHGMGIARVDVDTGQITTTTLAASDELKAEIFYAIGGGSTYVAVLDVAGQGTLDTTVAIDPDTLRRTARAAQRGTGTNIPLFTSGPPPLLTMTSSRDGIVAFDPLTLEVGDAIDTGGDTTGGHTDRGELWAWNRDGSVRVFDRTGSEIATVQLDITLPNLNSGAALTTSASFWLANGDEATLARVDRRTMQHTHTVSLRDHFDWADAVRLRRSTAHPKYVIAHVVDDGRGWWMLVGIDHENGAVLSSHVIAIDSFEYGWNAFDGPLMTTVGERLFVRDHLRRLVEVDVAALDTPSAEPWVDPGLGREPILTGVEVEIADLTLAFLRGGDVPIADDPRSTAAVQALRGLGAARNADEWHMYGVDVDGERAWSRAGPVGEGVGAFFVFERVDGEWRVSVEGLCALLAASPLVCD